MFVSLKWKALFVTCVLFLTLFIGRAVSTYVFFSTQVDHDRTENLERNSKIIQSVIDNTFTELQNLAVETDVLYNAFSVYTQKSPPQAKKIIEAELEDYWWKMQLERDINTIALYNNDNQRLMSFGNDEYPLQLIIDTNLTEQPKSRIVCQNSCYIFSTSPLLLDGKHVGAAIYGTSFSGVILKLKALTNADIAIILRENNGGKDRLTSIRKWSSEILAITDMNQLLPVIKEASTRYTITDINNTPEVFDYHDQQYEMATVPLPIDKNSLSGEILLINNVTASTQSFHNLFISNILYDGIGLIILGLCLVGILWRPMNQLRIIAQVIPQLGNNAFNLVRDSLHIANSRFQIMDESHTLSKHSIDLANKLEAMHNQLQERNAELEYQSRALQKERDFATGLLNTAHAVIITHDHTGTITLVNEHACQATGYTREELIGEKFYKLFSGQHLPDDYAEHLDMLLTGSNSTYQHEADLRCKNGKNRYMAWYHSALRDEETTYNHILTVALDISERKKAEDHLGWLASHDTLTGLFNRRRFHEELESALALCEHYEHKAALLFIDLDNFKDVNDTSGHHVGDLLLKEVSETLKQQTRDSDIVGRFGGDEFAMLLQDTSAEDAELVARRLCTYISAITVSGEEHSHQASCSIGIAMCPQDATTIADILAKADIAMYNAKKSGRNNWCFYDESLLSKEDIRERLYWDKLVKTALANDLIVLYFQPIMRIKQRQISHYECLLRIKEGDKILPPIKFVQAAEEGGLMAMVDEHVIRLAFQHKKALEAQGIKTSLAINLSGLSFQSSNLSYHVQACLDEYRINPREIIFEITETSAVFDIGSSKQLMTHFKEMGFSFALDDFGAGFSSLAYLKQFPIDYIKIDGAFIRNIDTDLEDQVLVKTIVDTAAAFKLKTIAEFVENQSSLLLLESMGIDFAQGYYIDKPKAFGDVWDIKVGEPDNSQKRDEPDQPGSSLQL